MAGVEQGFEPGLPDPPALHRWVQGSPTMAGPYPRAPGPLPGPRHDLQGPRMGVSLPSTQRVALRPWGGPPIFKLRGLCLPRSTVGHVAWALTVCLLLLPH